MDTRKEYVEPTVESEEILEQTALQCTNSLDLQGTIPDLGCAIKHNAFYEQFDGWWCAVWPIYFDEAQCAINTIGLS